MNYKTHEGEPQPRIVAVKVDVDIFPDERRVSARGQQILKNKTAVDIQKIFITVRPESVIDLKMLEDSIRGSKMLNTPSYPVGDDALGSGSRVLCPGVIPTTRSR